MQRPYIRNMQVQPPIIVGPLFYSEAYGEALIHFTHTQWVNRPETSTQSGVHWKAPYTDVVSWARERFGESALRTFLTEPVGVDERSYVLDIRCHWTYFDREFMFRSADAAMEFKLRWA